MITLANVILLLTLPAVVAFPVLYARRSPWRALRVGRSMMYLSISLAVLMLNNAASLWFPEYPGRPLVRVLVYGALLLSTWGQLRTLVKVQNGVAGYVSELHSAQTSRETIR